MISCSGSGGVGNIVAICIVWLTRGEIIVYFLKENMAAALISGGLTAPQASPKPPHICAHITKVCSVVPHLVYFSHILEHLFRR